MSLKATLNKLRRKAEQKRKKEEKRKEIASMKAEVEKLRKYLRGGSSVAVKKSRKRKKRNG